MGKQTYLPKKVFFFADNTTTTPFFHSFILPKGQNPLLHSPKVIFVVLAAYFHAFNSQNSEITSLFPSISPCYRIYRDDGSPWHKRNVKPSNLDKLSPFKITFDPAPQQSFFLFRKDRKQVCRLKKRIGTYVGKKWIFGFLGSSHE